MSDATSAYVGFLADRAGLRFYGKRWHTPGRRRARLTPEGLQLDGTGQTDPLTWDEFLPDTPCLLRKGSETNWWVEASPTSRTGSSVCLGADPANYDRPPRLRLQLVDPFLNSIFPAARPGSVVLEALCHYLSDTPAARAGLADPTRCTRLVDGLRAGKLVDAPRHEQRLYVGQRGDVRQALDKAYSAKVRLYRGRRIDGEPVPTTDELADLTRQRLPHWIDAHNATPEILAGMAADWATRTPWPFGVLAVG